MTAAIAVWQKWWTQIHSARSLCVTVGFDKNTHRLSASVTVGDMKALLVFKYVLGNVD